MIEVSGVKYARTNDGVHIAYRVAGDGPLDVIVIPGWASHVELFGLNRWLDRRLTSFSRVIWFDKRGTGASDPVPVDRLPTLEQRMDDVRAVLDAVGSDRAALIGASEGGPMAILYAATYPDRVAALVLCGTYASQDWETSPWRRYADTPDQFQAQLEAHWAEAYPGAECWMPSVADDEGVAEMLAHGFQMAASPAAAAALFRMSIDMDVRPALSTLRVPTLVIHQVGDRVCDVAQGRLLAHAIAGARYVELPGIDHMVVKPAEQEQLLDAIEEFLTGMRSAPHADRVLATVLFTDIVASTEHAAAIGDRRWREVLDQHDALVTQEVARHRGRVIKTTGDGVLATFDGPARAICCACAIRDAMTSLGIEVRSGLHTGEVEVRGHDVGGIAVNIAARVETAAAPGEVLVSGSVPPLVVGSGITFDDRGPHVLKGMPDTWQLYAVTGT